MEKTDGKTEFAVVPEEPPEQVRRMSPSVSEMPSARTAGFTAPVAQVNGGGLGLGYAGPRDKNSAHQKQTH